MSIDPFLVAAIAKILITMMIVVLASLLVERTSPFIGAMIATLPISAGPSYVFLAMDHDAAFVAQSAVATLFVNGANAIFVAVYAHAAQRWSMVPSLAAALAVWTFELLVLRLLPWTAGIALVFNVLAFGLAYYATRPLMNGAPEKVSGRRWWEIPVRALGVAAITATVMIAGFVLGPAAAGIAAPFPIVLSSLVVILHPRLGGPATATTLAHALPGLAGFALAILIVSETTVALGSAMSLSLALLFCLLFNGALVLRQWREAAKIGRQSRQT